MKYAVDQLILRPRLLDKKTMNFERSTVVLRERFPRFVSLTDTLIPSLKGTSFPSSFYSVHLSRFFLPTTTS